MKRKTKNIILISILCFICALLVAGIAVVVSVFVGDGCDMPEKDSSSSSSSSSSSVIEDDDSSSSSSSSSEPWSPFV